MCDGAHNLTRMVTKKFPDFSAVHVFLCRARFKVLVSKTSSMSLLLQCIDFLEVSKSNITSNLKYTAECISIKHIFCILIMNCVFHFI